MRLGDIAHARAGDKGAQINVSVIAFAAADYARIERWVTPDRVAAHLSDLAMGDVVRHALPDLAAFNFVFTRRDPGGVTRTLALDAHGKSISSAMLTLEIPDDHE